MRIFMWTLKVRASLWCNYITVWNYFTFNFIFKEINKTKLDKFKRDYKQCSIFIRGERQQIECMLERYNLAVRVISGACSLSPYKQNCTFISRLMALAFNMTLCTHEVHCYSYDNKENMNIYRKLPFLTFSNGFSFIIFQYHFLM